MIRLFVLLGLAVSLAACSASLSREDALSAAADAEAQAKPREALRYYKVAAEQGDLEAMKTVASAYRDGYHRAQSTRGTFHQGERGSTFMPILVLPGQARRWQARYERERDARALAGDPAAWMRVADDLTIWKRDDTQADRDSARAIRQRLIEEGYHGAMLHAAFRLMRDDREDGMEMLRRAEEAGSPQACLIRVNWSRMASSPEDVDISALATASLIDALEACPPLDTDEPQRGAQIIANLRANAANDRYGASAHLDSLRALGVFDRHPRLDS